MKCHHTQVKFTETPELTHHGKETCLTCGAFVRWVPKPETQERARRNASNIVRLRADGRLTAWQREFIASVEGQGPKLSPKQQVILDEIAAKYV